MCFGGLGTKSGGFIVERRSYARYRCNINELIF